MKNLITIIALATSLQLGAQSTLIEFDYQTEQYTFYKVKKNGNRVQKKQPYSYRNIPVTIVIKDLNTNHYSVTFESKSFDEIPIGSEDNVETLLASYTSGMGAFNQLIGEVKENDIYNSLFKDGKFQGLDNLVKAYGAGADEADTYLEKIEDYSKDLKKSNDELVSASEEVDKLVDYMTLLDFTNEELAKLMHNPHLSHAEIKNRAEVLTKEVFEGPIELSNVISKSSEKAKVINRYNTAYSNFQAGNEALKYTMDAVKPKLKSDDTRFELDSYSRKVDQRQKSIEDNYKSFETTIGTLSADEIRRKMMAIYESYDKISTADFNYEYSFLTDRDVTQLVMRFGLAGNDTIGTIKTRVLNVPTHGGLRINSSAGMSFATFMNGQNSYLNNSGVVEEVKGDLFSPAISTMFHFYRQSYRPFTIGGSFGLSVPIEGQKDFIYMTGASIIIGKSQRVIFNIGGLGGKVERLTDGLKAGDALISEYSEVPTKRVFDFGLYAGVTFNVNSLFGGGAKASGSAPNSSAAAPTTNYYTNTTSSGSSTSSGNSTSSGVNNINGRATTKESKAPGSRSND
jgi:hypothetical protein